MPELDIPDDSERIVQTKFIQSMHRSLQTLLSVSMEQSIPTLFLKRLKKKKDTRCLEVVNNQRENHSRKKDS